MAIKHTFTSAKPDVADATKVGSTKWNAEHVLDGGTDGDLLVRDAGDPSGAAWENTRLYKPTSRRSGWISVHPSTNPNTEGLATGLVLAGTRVWSPDMDNEYVQFSATTMMLFGVYHNGTWPATASFSIRHGLDIRWEIFTGPSLANCRYAIGISDSIQTGSSDGGGSLGLCLRFRFSTAAGDTTQWKAQAGNGTSEEANAGAIAVSTRYVLRIQVPIGGGSATFSVNDITPVVLSGKIPIESTIFGQHVLIDNLVAEAKSFKIGGMYAEWNFQ